MAFLPETSKSNPGQVVGVQPTNPPSNPIPVTDTALAPPTAILNGQVTIAAPRVPLAAAATPIKSVTIENPIANAVVYVGNAAVAAGNGYRLQPGATVSIAIDDLNKVNVAGTAGNIVSYIAVN